MGYKHETPIPWEAMGLPDYLMAEYKKYYNEFKQEQLYAPAPMPPPDVRECQESDDSEERKVIIVDL